MPEKILVGGFASEKQQIDRICTTLSGYYDEDVVGMNFREARQNPRRLADFISKKDVITHSAGFVALQNVLNEWGMLPNSITAIAPPIPERIRHLLWRGFTMGASAKALPDGVSGRSSALKDELLLHARTHFGALPLISRFNAFDAAGWDDDHGIDTTIAVMSRDDLFPLQSDNLASASGVGRHVVRIMGDHFRFSHEPVQVLGEIAALLTTETVAA